VTGPKDPFGEALCLAKSHSTFRVLYVFLVLSFDRRRVVHWNVTSGATAEWVAQQIVEVFP
jgi:hypothetical protein